MRGRGIREIHIMNERSSDEHNVNDRNGEGRIIAACGNDCAVCPRYVKPPYEKTPEELRHTAELWCRIGYRDRVVGNREISCEGCTPDKTCRYDIAGCCADHEVPNCGKCPDYPCRLICECFSVTATFMPACRKICTDEEYAVMKKAFYEKKKNLDAEKKSDGRQ